MSERRREMDRRISERYLTAPSQRDAIDHPVVRFTDFLTGTDPEPPRGTTVDDVTGQRWTRDHEIGPDSWLREGHEDGDPESWTKVAGNYGPVLVVRDDLIRASDADAITVRVSDGEAHCRRDCDWRMAGGTEQERADALARHCARHHDRAVTYYAEDWNDRCEIIAHTLMRELGICKTDAYFAAHEVDYALGKMAPGADPRDG